MAVKAAVRFPARRVFRMPLTQARVHLGGLVKRVHLGKELVVLEKDGIPVAGLMDIDEFEDYLELQDVEVREHIRKSHIEYLAGKSRPATDLLQELSAARTKRRSRSPRLRRK